MVPVLPPVPLTDVLSKVGVPFTITIFVLWQLAPRIDRLIEINDRVSAQLTVFQAECRAAPRFQTLGGGT